MGYKPVSAFGPAAIDIKKLGVPVEGIYQGRRDITTKIGPQIVWELDGLDGEEFGVYGFTNLNSQMANVRPGTRVKITYQGTKEVKTKYGLKQVHQVEVAAWSDDDDDLPV